MYNRVACCCSLRFVLLQTTFATEKDEHVLWPFDIVFATTLRSPLSPCKLNRVCVRIVRLSRL